MQMELVVRGRWLGDGDEVITYESSLVAVPISEDVRYTSEEEVDAWFFPADFVFPLAGEWVLVPISGANRGCFVITAQEPRPW